MGYANSHTLLLQLFLLLLPFFSHAYQACPEHINYHCPDSSATSVQFPFTNYSLPDCGFCVLECKDHANTTIQCGQQQLSYKTKEIFPDNTTIVLVYPGLHELTSNVCKIHRSDSVIIPTPPLTTFTILNLMVFFRCPIGHANPAALGNHFTICGDDVVYGPYAADGIPKGLPPDCTAIKLPNSTDDYFSIRYNLPDDCSRCAHDMSECVDLNTSKYKCPP